MYPVKDLKEVITFLGALVGLFPLAMADGKIGLDDAGLLMGLVPSVGPAFEGISNVPNEFGDITVEERAELDAHIDAVFGAGKAPEIGEEVMQIAMRLGRIITIVKKAPEAPAPEAPQA